VFDDLCDFVDESAVVAEIGVAVCDGVLIELDYFF